MADLCSIANKASKKAKVSGDPDDHAAAAVAHERASKLMLAEGDAAKAQKHAQRAEDHRLQSDSDSSSSESNPLLTWTKAKV